ncbi:DNA replication and repair protein RecF [Striga asiatica]|uniref:DNA replication and repair protein RecF n=1 Tax=Striga asiatica TaxID=4170 RepID=A0A5A7NWM0_STRAF|nr:DNA replication and repair protein RecF [Striga asiatica]
MAAVRFRFGYPRFLVLRFSVLVPNFTHGFAVSGTRKSSVLVRILYFARGAPLATPPPTSRLKKNADRTLLLSRLPCVTPPSPRLVTDGGALPSRERGAPQAAARQPRPDFHPKQFWFWFWFLSLGFGFGCPEVPSDPNPNRCHP